MAKTVLITGASTGIGYELGKLYSKDGYSLILVARSKDKLEEVAREYKEKYSAKDVKIFVADLSNPSSIQDLYQYTKKENIKVDELINNAGFGTNGKFWENKLEKELSLVRLNIESLLHLTHLFLKDMITVQSGKILNVASTAAFQPGPYMSSYYASKAFVLHFSEGISEEAKEYHVQVSTLCPGPTITEFFKNANMDTTKLTQSWFVPVMTGKEVAEIAYKEFQDGKTIIIPGFVNAMTPIASKFSPRALVRKIAGILNYSKR